MIENANKTIKRFEDLNVWKKARTLNALIYTLTSVSQDFKNDFSYVDQLRRSSISILNNIAEGFERQSDKEFVRFLYIARGSAAEVRNLIYIASDLSYINKTTYEQMIDGVEEISKMLFGLIRYLEKK